MDDNEILEQREELISSIKQKEEEWDRYSKTYAGVAEYWEVQKNAYNEIAALKTYLSELPLTSKEKQKRAIKWLFIFCVSLSILYYFFDPNISVSFVKEWVSTISLISTLTYTLVWGISVLLTMVFYDVYKYVIDYETSGFGLYEAIEEIFEKEFFIFFAVVFILLILSHFWGSDIAVWSKDAWISWGIISLIATLVILVFYFIFGVIFIKIEPWDLPDILILSTIGCVVFVAFKFLNILLIG